METLEDIKGFITYSPEVEKQRPARINDEEEEKKKESELEKLQQEAQ